jgi:hypothetical protein
MFYSIYLPILARPIEWIRMFIQTQEDDKEDQYKKQKSDHMSTVVNNWD